MIFVPNDLHHYFFKVIFKHFENKVFYPRSFSFRIEIIVEDLEIPGRKVLSVRYLAFPPWKLPFEEYCRCHVSER